MNCRKWDEKYIDLAKHVAQWSKDPSSKVGAVVVKNNRVVAVGFNGFPSEVEDRPEWLDNRKVKYEMVVHAEVNALIVAGQRAEGATIYVHGRPVCSACAGAILQAGIVRVVAQEPPSVAGGLEGALARLTAEPETKLDKEIWTIKGHVARNMFNHAEVSFDSFPVSCLAEAMPNAAPTAANDDRRGKRRTTAAGSSKVRRDERSSQPTLVKK